MSDRFHIGKRVRHYRQRRQMRAEALGGLLGRSASWVRMVERGEIVGLPDGGGVGADGAVAALAGLRGQAAAAATPAEQRHHRRGQHDAGHAARPRRRTPGAAGPPTCCSGGGSSIVRLCLAGGVASERVAGGVG
jgi:Helix-turn-helix domain